MFLVASCLSTSKFWRAAMSYLQDCIWPMSPPLPWPLLLLLFPLLTLIQLGSLPCLSLQTPSTAYFHIRPIASPSFPPGFSLPRYFHGLLPQRGQIGIMLLPCTVTLFPFILLYFLTELSPTIHKTYICVYHLSLPLECKQLICECQFCSLLTSIPRIVVPEI